MQSRRNFHHGNLRAVLITAAIREIEKGGLPQLSLKQLAIEARVTQSAPYRHFRSKLALIGAILQQEHESVVAEFSNISPALSAMERLRAAGKIYLDYARRRPQLFQLFFADDLFWKREHGHRPAFNTQVYALLQGMVAAVIGKGTSGARIRKATLSCLSLLHGFAALRNAGATRLIRPSVTEEKTVLDVLEQLAQAI
jgi:AcrR family transcriptional regulator